MDGEFSPITKDVACRKKIFVKLNYSIKTSMITSFFSEFLVKFLRNSIKCVLSRAVSGALPGVRKVALLRAMAVPGTVSDDPCK